MDATVDAREILDALGWECDGWRRPHTLGVPCHFFDKHRCQRDWLQRRHLFDDPLLQIDGCRCLCHAI